jgi:ribosome-associated protein
MNKQQLLKELQFKAVRSSGAGGQNVNKVSSKVVLIFNVMQSLGINSQEKELVLQRWVSKLTTEQVLVLQCDEDRSQFRNKTIVIQRFLDLISQALIVPKKRKPTKIPRSVIEKRIKAKRNWSEIKQNRQKPQF